MYHIVFTIMEVNIFVQDLISRRLVIFTREIDLSVVNINKKIRVHVHLVLVVGKGVVLLIEIVAGGDE